MWSQKSREIPLKKKNLIRTALNSGLYLCALKSKIIFRIKIKKYQLLQRIFSPLKFILLEVFWIIVKRNDLLYINIFTSTAELWVIKFEDRTLLRESASPRLRRWSRVGARFFSFSSFSVFLSYTFLIRFILFAAVNSLGIFKYLLTVSSLYLHWLR